MSKRFRCVLQAFPERITLSPTLVDSRGQHIVGLHIAQIYVGPQVHQEVVVLAGLGSF